MHERKTVLFNLINSNRKNKPKYGTKVKALC